MKPSKKKLAATLLEIADADAEMAFVHRLVSAEYDGMPSSALKEVFNLLRSKTGHDFSKYKPSTIHRRIERRLAVQHIETMEEYVAYLQQNPQEVEALFHDLLIGVTSFFRDPDIFEKLETEILPMIFGEKPNGSNIRVWCAGCSTGEEAYSIAILLQEQLEELKKDFHIQLYATDIDNYAISTAQSGIYPASIAADITPERLSRFFTVQAVDHAFRINKNLRDMLIFSEQSIIKDPPFSKIDLISCRNLLIYMNDELQKTVMPLFHYALNPGGILLLGSSETIGNYDTLYTTLDRKNKIYQRIDDNYNSKTTALPEPADTPEQVDTPVQVSFPEFEASQEISATARKQDSQVGRPDEHTQIYSDQSLREIVEQIVLTESQLVGVLVTESGDILYFHGRTGLYLEPTPGIAGIPNVIRMAREGLQKDLSRALLQASITKGTVRQQGISINTNGHFRKVSFSVRPVIARASAANKKPLFMVIFEMGKKLGTDGQMEAKPSSEPDMDISIHLEKLRTELSLKDDYLQSTNEELETSNDELKASNEQMLSVNKELQSANEDLETSKEALQSISEDKSTYNQ